MSKYDLKDVQKITNRFLLGNTSLIEFTAPSRSTLEVIKIFHIDVSQATSIVAEGLAALKPNDFANTHMQWSTAVDVYGLEGYHDQNWYVKFCLFDDDGTEKIESISFHPVERDLKLADGRVLRVTSIAKGAANGKT